MNTTALFIVELELTTYCFLSLLQNNNERTRPKSHHCYPQRNHFRSRSQLHPTQSRSVNPAWLVSWYFLLAGHYRMTSIDVRKIPEFYSLKFNDEGAWILITGAVCLCPTSSWNPDSLGHTRGYNSSTPNVLSTRITEMSCSFGNWRKQLALFFHILLFCSKGRSYTYRYKVTDGIQNEQQ